MVPGLPRAPRRHPDDDQRQGRPQGRCRRPRHPAHRRPGSTSRRPGRPRPVLAELLGHDAGRRPGVGRQPLLRRPRRELAADGPVLPPGCASETDLPPIVDAGRLPAPHGPALAALADAGGGGGRPPSVPPGGDAAGHGCGTCCAARLQVRAVPGVRLRCLGAMVVDASSGSARRRRPGDIYAALDGGRRRRLRRVPPAADRRRSGCWSAAGRRRSSRSGAWRYLRLLVGQG